MTGKLMWKCHLFRFALRWGTGYEDSLDGHEFGASESDDHTQSRQAVPGGLSEQHDRGPQGKLSPCGYQRGTVLASEN